MRDSTNDKNIEIQLIKGDQKAFEAFYRLHFAELWSFATYYVMSKEIARDIVQDCFVVLLERRKQIDSSQSLKGYLYTVVKNRCMDHFRSHKIADTNRERLIEAIIFSGEQDYNEEIIERVNGCKERLSEQQRRVITLKTEGKNYSQIAHELGITEATVNVHIKNAYKFFRNNMLIFFAYFQ